MAKKKLYDVYDVYDDGRLIESGITKDYILAMTGRKNISLCDYVEKGILICGRYRISNAGKKLNENIEIDEDRKKQNIDFIKEWSQMQKLFKKAEWVKSGGRRLMVE